MRNIDQNKPRYVGFGILTLLLFLFSWITFATYNVHHEPANPLITFAGKYHVGIMAALFVISVAFGFVFSQSLYIELKKKRKETESILNVVLLFLNAEEKSIINYLVKMKGETTQAEISRLPKMTRVKAYRSLQKMQEKGLIEVIPHGKIRRIVLKDNILNVLSEREK